MLARPRAFAEASSGKALGGSGEVLGAGMAGGARAAVMGSELVRAQSLLVREARAYGQARGVQAARPRRQVALRAQPHAEAAETAVVREHEGAALSGLRVSRWTNFRPLSSCHGWQAVLNRSYRSDRCDPGLTCGIKSGHCTDRDAKGFQAGRAASATSVHAPRLRRES